MTKTVLWVAVVAGMVLLWTRPWAQQPVCGAGETPGPEGQCLKPYDGEFTPIECPAGQLHDKHGKCIAFVDPWTAPQGRVVDSGQTERNNALSEQRWAAAKESMAADERALQLRQQLAENSRREQRAYEEAALRSRHAQETTVYNNVIVNDPYAAPRQGYSARHDSGRIIRDANSMPNVTAVQVAPDRVWDYSTGQYHWASEQADGSLQVREGE